MSTSLFSPFMSMSGDSDTDKRRRMMMAMMLQRGGDQGDPQSPFAGALQGLQSGIGNGIMLADLYDEFNKNAPGSGTFNQDAVNTQASPLWGSSDAAQSGNIPGSDFGTPSSVSPSSGSFWDKGSYQDLAGSQSPLSYGFSNFGQGLSNMGYGIGNWFGGLF